MPNPASTATLAVCAAVLCSCENAGFLTKRTTNDAPTELVKARKALFDMQQGLVDGSMDKTTLLRYYGAYLEPKTFDGDAATQDAAVALRAAIASGAGEGELMKDMGSSLDKYILKVAPAFDAAVAYAPPRSATESEYYSIFGCETWGMKRVPGSNACMPAEADAKKAKSWPF